jgi:pilus assembly protein Flp/PilA
MTRTSSRVRRTDRGSSTVEYSLMVAALAAVLVGVIVAAGAVAGSGIGRACSSMSTQLAVGGDCSGTGTTGGTPDSTEGAAGDQAASTDNG